LNDIYNHALSTSELMLELMERYKDMGHQICRVLSRTISGKGQLQKSATIQVSGIYFHSPTKPNFPSSAENLWKGKALSVLKHHTMMMYGETEVQLHHSWPWYQMEVSGQLHTPATLLPGKQPLVHTGQEAGWFPEPVWTIWRRKKFCPCGTRNPAVQPIASLYTNWAIVTPPILIWI
jgi:hypothetical protein